ncbi:MAG TPA: hypothetical protein VEW67_04065 [Thermoleophilaceae bacterium]|nr:hypothetical protein [Thermoleophilaceae bacterium]
MADSIVTAPPTLAHAVDPHDPDYLIVGERRLKRLRGGDGNDPADPDNGGAVTPPALPNGPDGTPFDTERVLRALRQSRSAEREARDGERTAREELTTANGQVTDLRSQVAQLQQQLQEAGGLSTEDAEAAQRRETELQSRETAAQDALRQGRLLTELAKPEHGIVDAEAAAQLIVGVEFDAEGNPTNLTVKDGEDPESKSLLDGFLEARPFLRSGAAPPPPAPSIDGGAGNGQQPVVDLTAEELEAADKAGLSPQQYQARKGVRTLKDWQATRAQESAAATQ